MALNCAYTGWCANKTLPLETANFKPRNSGLIMNLRYDMGKCHEWKHCSLRALAAIPPEDDNMKLLNPLPKASSAADLSPSHGDGSKVRIAYQGLPGAFGEEAALKAFPNCEPVPFEGDEAAFKAVKSCEVDKAIISIENSVRGSIYRNYDLLMRHELHIVGEMWLRIDHLPLGLSSVRKDYISYVTVDDQALAKCEKMLDDLDVTKVDSPHTAGATQGNYENITRFLILEREPIIPETDWLYKTSIVFSLEKGFVLFYDAVKVFSNWDIEWEKLVSRPLKECPKNEGGLMEFNYLIYIDLEASLAEPRTQYALRDFQKRTRFLRVLGCYRIQIENFVY